MIRTIAVIGAGTMGHAIAGCFARYGLTVSVFESFEQPRKGCKDKIRAQYQFFCSEGMMKPEEIDGALANITMFADLEPAVHTADYIIEAIPESLELKRDLFAKLDRFCKPEAIIASNTSSLSFAGMTEGLPAARVAQMMVNHFYNPAHIMPLVELSFFGNMEESVYKEVEALYLRVEKRPAKVQKDVPGLVANRIQQAVAREVFSLMQMGVAEPADIDAALKFGPAFRYATTGQLEVADFGGLDVWCTVGDNLLSVMDNRKEASSLLREKVLEGKLGFKSGQGFFTYPEDKKAETQDEFNRRLVHQLKASKAY